MFDRGRVFGQSVTTWGFPAEDCQRVSYFPPALFPFPASARPFAQYAFIR